MAVSCKVCLWQCLWLSLLQLRSGVCLRGCGQDGGSKRVGVAMEVDHSFGCGSNGDTCNIKPQASRSLPPRPPSLEPPEHKGKPPKDVLYLQSSQGAQSCGVSQRSSTLSVVKHVSCLHGVLHTEYSPPCTGSGAIQGWWAAQRPTDVPRHQARVTERGPTEHRGGVGGRARDDDSFQGQGLCVSGSDGDGGQQGI